MRKSRTGFLSGLNPSQSLPTLYSSAERIPQQFSQQVLIFTVTGGPILRVLPLGVVNVLCGTFITPGASGMLKLSAVCHKSAIQHINDTQRVGASHGKASQGRRKQGEGGTVGEEQVHTEMGPAMDSTAGSYPPHQAEQFHMDCLDSAPIQMCMQSKGDPFAP